MTKKIALNILRRILPWACESNAGKPQYKRNYKGARGRIGIVGGARDYSGAPYFASISAMRLGADLAYVICSSQASQVIKAYSPDLIVTPILDCDDEKVFLNEIGCLMDRLHAVVIGPGLGREKLMLDRARTFIHKAKVRSLPLVLDADSLMLVIEDPSIVKSYSNALLTPNRIELQRILNSLYAPKTFELRNLPTNEIIELVRKCSNDLGVSILAKGLVDIICQPSGLLLTTDESSGSNRRCGGQGDILSGLAGTYLHWIAQANIELKDNKIDNPVAWAAYLAALTTRTCNELAYKEHRNGMLASNMIDKLHITLDLLLGASQADDLNSSVNRIKHVCYASSLTQDEIKRYTRQMIMDEFGPEAQLKLKQASALIIGAGGLGCPAAAYLGAGGIGRLGLVDDDTVEASNLHRQILHSVNKVGMLKTESIKEAVLAINPNVEVVCHSVKMDRYNAVELVENYDFVIDATDNLITRYMINDACVVAKKPLISGAALKMDGQLTVYNYDHETPCFRCLFPEPPPAAAVGSCSDNGVLGAIPGVIGVLQALEAIKMGAGMTPAYVRKMLLFDGQLGFFRHVTLGKRKQDCKSCGEKSELKRDLIDYQEFCAMEACENQSLGKNDILTAGERVTVEEYRSIMEKGEPHVLIDVRPKAHSDISRFEHALAIPLIKLIQEQESSLKRIKSELEMKKSNQVYVVCRRGIASQRATKALQEMFANEGPAIVVKDIIGGMTAWSKRIDSGYSCL